MHFRAVLLHALVRREHKGLPLKATLLRTLRVWRRALRSFLGLDLRYERPHVSFSAVLPRWGRSHRLTLYFGKVLLVEPVQIYGTAQPSCEPPALLVYEEP